MSRLRRYFVLSRSPQTATTWLSSALLVQLANVGFCQCLTSKFRVHLTRLCAPVCLAAERSVEALCAVLSLEWSTLNFVSALLCVFFLR